MKKYNTFRDTLMTRFVLAIENKVKHQGIKH